MGSGAIPLSRAQYFPYKEIIGMDINPHNVEVAKRRLRKFPRTRVIQGNALQMRAIPNESIDVIVTDPPWGIFTEFESEPREFYPKILERMNYVLKSRGRIVILTAARNEVEKATKSLDWFPEKTFDILVSGKKAGIYYFIKS